MFTIKHTLSLAFLLLLGAITAKAQPHKVVADKIVAVVGDRIILQSDIRNSIEDARRQGSTVPEGAECMLMEQAVISKVLMLQAEKDSLPVSDEDVEAELDQRVRHFINQVGSQQAVGDFPMRFEPSYRTVPVKLYLESYVYVLEAYIATKRSYSLLMA